MPSENSSLLSAQIDKYLPKKYRVEIVLIFISVIVILIGLSGYLQKQEEAPAQEEKIVFADQNKINTKKNISEEIYIEISGSVKKPGLYKVTPDKRVNDLINMAGGLSEEADLLFFSRNFNLASKIYDQEKIYVPSYTEIQLANFNYKAKMPKIITIPSNSENNSKQNQVHINTASSIELQVRLSISKNIADEIVQFRPYGSIYELAEKKVLSTTTFNKIKDLISL